LADSEPTKESQANRDAPAEGTLEPLKIRQDPKPFHTPERHLPMATRTIVQKQCVMELPTPGTGMQREEKKT
jgi:hypothetical protein